MEGERQISDFEESLVLEKSTTSLLKIPSEQVEEVPVFVERRNYLRSTPSSRDGDYCLTTPNWRRARARAGSLGSLRNANTSRRGVLTPLVWKTLKGSPRGPGSRRPLGR